MGQEILSLQEPGKRVTDVAFSPDGLRLACGSEDAVRIWDATPLSPERALDREALGVVRFYFAKVLLRPEVLERIRADLTLSEPVRQRALGLAADHPEDVRVLLDRSGTLASRPGAPPAQYVEALRLAHVAYGLAPTSGECATVLGLAQYRLGSYAEAKTTLTQPEKRTEPSLLTEARYVRHILLLAMAHHQLGEAEAVKQQLDRLRKIQRHAIWATHVRDEELRLLLAEADGLLKTKLLVPEN
jgi:hypothetical protein